MIVTGCSMQDNASYNMSVSTCATAHLIDCILESATQGLHVHSGGSMASASGCTFLNNKVHNVRIVMGGAAVLADCKVVAAGCAGMVVVGASSRCDAKNCYFIESSSV